jgi:hypothetical protein
MSTKTKKCTKTHSVYCSITRMLYKDVYQEIHFKVHTDDGTYMKLWYPCPSKQRYDVICYDLGQYTYWKFFYLCDSREIVRMEAQNWICTVQ